MGMRHFTALAVSTLAIACGPTTSGPVPPAPVADAGGSDVGGTSNDVDVSAAGQPIDAPLETWTWVDFPDSVCGNGQPTGIGVNLTDRSEDVLIYFIGGGACWDVNSCFVLESAVNIETGYTGTRFDNDPIRSADAFDRTLEGNPFRDMSYVFIPYCTGDLHAGDKVTAYAALGQTREVHHRGAHNVEQFLDRVVPTFPDATRVFVSGSSAGGYGAQLNMHQFVEQFDAAEVHVLSDSGPLVQPWDGRFGQFNAAWTFQTPESCADCGDGLPQWFDHLTSAYPDSRIGLLTYDADQTIHLYFNYPIGMTFQTALTSLIDNRYGTDNTSAFVLAGTQHVLLGNLMTIESPSGVSLADWTSAWVEGGEWESVRP